ncbi:MAG: peptidase T [Defluviitaleaceae bacterium]|nr:peptidase T [Defluviitaleaceae bacterium]
MMSVSECFLNLITYDTQADGCSDTYPSTHSQLKFAAVLAEQCKAIGLSQVEVDKHGYLTATLPSNVETDTNIPIIGLLAHMDTSPDASGESVNARVVKDYDGKDIKLNDQVVLSPKEFAHLNNYIGQDLIVTDGTTLLGADDKAGIAEILTAMKYLIDNNDTIPHGTIRIAFTPDEEIGCGVDYFDVAGFGADFAYTIDGGEIGELECENFNGAQATFTIRGKSVHPGTAKGVMINASQVAGEIIAAFPANETPSHTEEYEGFYHLTAMVGEVGSGKLAYILRDHDANKFEERKKFVLSVADSINQKYGQGTVKIDIQDQYRNMHEILKDHMYVMDRAKKAMESAGVTPIITPIRGGTDGARLSFMGLPCPNIFQGGHNAHGPYEYIPIQSMEAAVKVIVNICRSDL